MMDGRRSRWIAFDVQFLGGQTGAALFDRFGAAGVALFIGWLCACKMNPIQGRVSFVSDEDCLAQFGLTGLRLVDNDGGGFTLEEFWRWLGQRKQARRTYHGRITNVHATRWDRWQNTPGTRATDDQDVTKTRARRAQDARKTRGNPQVKGQKYNGITFPDSDSDSDITPPTPPTGGVCPICHGRREYLPFGDDTMRPCPDCTKPELRVVGGP
jgi:hypothetical protein